MAPGWEEGEDCGCGVGGVCRGDWSGKKWAQQPKVKEAALCRHLRRVRFSVRRTRPVDSAFAEANPTTRSGGVWIAAFIAPSLFPTESVAALGRRCGRSGARCGRGSGR